jgi:glycosyltransferase involved in cell wall biosynthesis
MTPKVSIIIPVFNREELVSETLKSIIDQTFSDWECILVDDGSTDNSLKIVQEFASSDPRIKVYSRPETLEKGAPSCRNFGYELSEGNYIQYFDSDDLMLKEMLQKKVDFLERNKDVSFVVAKMGDFNSTGRLPNPEYQLKLPNDNLWNFMRYRIFFLTPGPLFRKQFLDGFKIKFDASLDRRQEREFYTRIMLKNPEYLTIEEVLCLRRIHDSSIRNHHEELSELAQKRSSYLFYAKLSKNAGKRYAAVIYHAYCELIVSLIVSCFKKRSADLTIKSTLLLLTLFFNRLLFRQHKYG